MTGTRRIFTLFAVVAALSACVPSASAAVGRIVALGDSSATGTGLGSPLPGTPPTCGRSGLGYPDRAVSRIEHSEYVNVACDGARTNSLFWGSIDPPLIPAQFEQLSGNEDVVIVSVGANNANFGNVWFDCLYHDGNEANTCTDTYVNGSINQLVGIAEGIATSQQWVPSVSATIAKVHELAPHAEVFLVGYPRLTPPDGIGCRPSYVNLTLADAPVFAAWEDTLDATLASEALAAGAHFVDMHPSSLTHSACTPAGVRWMVPLLDPSASGEGVGLHPNSAGAEAVAQALLDAMEDAGLNLGPEDPGPSGETGETGQTGTTGQTGPTGTGSGGQGPEGSAKPPAAQPAIPLAILGLAPRRTSRSIRGSDFVRQLPTPGAVELRLSLAKESFTWLRLERRTTGRRAGNRCVARTSRNSHRKTCQRWLRATESRLMLLGGGTTTLHLIARDQRRPLARGRYRVSVALDSDQRSELRSPEFQITR
jgi:lysophospholipase L1-like esterase